MQGLVSKVGLSKEKAEQVAAFLKENASKVPEWLGKSETLKGAAKKIPGAGDVLG